MRTLGVVGSVGARTALGLTAPQTGFLLRTGATAIAAAPLVDGAGQAIAMCFDPTLDPYVVGEERAARLAGAALHEALAPLGEAARALSMRLVLCLDERYGQSAAQAAMLAARVHAGVREACPGATLELSARGAAAPAFALPKALEALGAGQVDAVLLGGVHTDYDPRRIARLDAAGRLVGAESLDALIPGEAAAFTVLTRDEIAQRTELPVLARLHDIGSGVERATPDNDESAFDAQGLTAAIRAASDTLKQDGLRVGWSLTDHAFEKARIAAWQTMVTRTHAIWGEPHVVESPAQRLGHLGAAAMPLQIALAAEAWRRGYAPAEIAMAVAGSDAGERGAILMSGG
jgi:3-oxoacyl-[acyl-carrier-protein] synthase I